MTAHALMLARRLIRRRRIGRRDQAAYVREVLEALSEPGFDAEGHPSMRLVQEDRAVHLLVLGAALGQGGIGRPVGREAYLRLVAEGLEQVPPANDGQDGDHRATQGRGDGVPLDAQPRWVNMKVLEIHLREVKERCGHLTLYGSLEAADAAWEDFVRPGEEGDQDRMLAWQDGRAGDDPDGWPLPPPRMRRIVVACPRCWRIRRRGKIGEACADCGPEHELVKMRENRNTMRMASPSVQRTIRSRMMPYSGEDLFDDEAASDAVRDLIADTRDDAMGAYYRRLGHGTKKEDE